MKKILVTCVLCSILLSGCSSDYTELMSYSGLDSGLNNEIGNYIPAAMADFITESLCYIPEDQNHMEDKQINAVSALSIDITNNKMIFSNNVYERVYPASTTKLLTALMVLKYGNLQDTVTVNKDNGGITVYGAKLCGFKAGETMTLETLLNSLLVYSGNDACVIIGEHMAGTEEAFVEQMNQEAAKIGAIDTHFVNSHGLHNVNHYTTAYDMYLIFQECLKYDLFKEIIQQTSYNAVSKDKEGNTVERKPFETTDLFVLGKAESPQGVKVLGGKTGSTGDAGECLIVYSQSDDETCYITGVFKAPTKASLYQQIAYLLTLEA